MNQEQYIEQEVQIRLHSEQFKSSDKQFKELRDSIQRLDDKLDSSIKHLDNKYMLMFSIILGSIWLPAILHYLHVT